MLMTTSIGPGFSHILRAYYCGPDHALRLRMWSWLRKLQQHRRLTIRYCGNGWLAVDERDLVQRYVLHSGFYEPEVWERLFAFAVDSEVVWDVGAHVGTFTLRSLLDPRVRVVHAFEPDPVTFEVLEWNTRLNCFEEGRFRLHNCAVA